MTDARFEDGAEAPLRLQALDADDLGVLSALVQDSVLNARDMRWQKGQRRFAMLLNRFRWEDRARAERAGDYERVQSLLVLHDSLARQGQMPAEINWRFENGYYLRFTQ